MAATARVTILMEPEEKTAFTKRAEDEGMSLSEWLRKKARGGTDPALEALIATLQQSTQHAATAIDVALAQLDARDSQQRSREQAVREKALEEFSTLDFNKAAALLAHSFPGHR